MSWGKIIDDMIRSRLIFKGIVIILSFFFFFFYYNSSHGPRTFIHAKTEILSVQQLAVLTRHDHFDAFKVTAKCLYTNVTFSLLFITRCSHFHTYRIASRLSAKIYYICL